ncbi:MAG: hypothetical protein K6C40_09485 [Thermoguttaceae bacterium]|nr:hypothetical protein [Thermoguttaceae bacterium]
MMKSVVLVVLSVLVLVGGLNVEAVQAQEIVEEVSSHCFSEEEALAYRERYMECGRNLDLQGKISISEEIGETGAERLCREKGWEPLLRKCDKGKNHSQGFDQVWRSNDGKIHVIEAKGISKGETANLSVNRFGHQQGTPEWAIDAAMDTLKTPAASEAEKRVAQQVLEAATKGEMNIDVIATEHVLGKPELPAWKSMRTCTEDAVSMARSALKKMPFKWAEDIREDSVAVRSGAKTISSTAEGTRSAAEGAKAAAKGTRAAVEGVEAASKAATVLKTTAKCAGVAAVGVDVGVRGYEAYQVETQYKNGQISQNERVKSHVKNAGSFAGGVGGATAGAYGGAAAGAAIGSIVPGPGTAIGGFVGGVAGAIGGYFAGDKAVKKGVDACWK